MAIDPLSGRTTSGLTRDTILAGLTRVQADLLTIQEQLASGKRLIRPSIDPIGTSLALSYRGRLDRNAQQRANAEDAVVRMTRADAALGSIADLLSSARTIALAQSDGSANATSRASAASEVARILEQAIAFANTTHEGRALFGGASGKTPFVQAGGGVGFAGDFAELLRGIGDGLSVADNLSAAKALGATAVLPAAAPGVATAPSGAGTVVDSAFIGRGAAAYDGLSLVVRAGPNAGQSRRIASFSSATGTFTLAAPFGAAFAGGEGFDVRFDLDPTLSRGGKAGATSAASGAGSLVAAETIGDGEDAYTFLELRATSGANAGQSRQITGFSSATGTFTFASAFSAGFAAGDTWEIRAAATGLGDLRGGLGVDAGSIRVSDGVGGPSVTVDLAGVLDIGDLLDTLNRAFDTTLPTLSAGLNAAGNGLEIVHSGAGTIVVEEVGNGTTAAQLGIATGPAGVLATLTGGDLDPVLALGTQLAQFRGGLGLDTAGFTVTNGALSATVALTGAFTVEDLANRVAAAGVQAAVEIADGGRSLDLRTLLSGAELRVSNAGGATASTLGWLHTLHRSETRALNAGAGLRTTAGADLRITTRTGATFEIDLDGASTVSALLDRINTAPGNASLGSPILARVDELTGALVLDDRGVDGGSDLTVTSTTGSFAAEGLGIAATAVNPPGVDPVLTLAGTPLAPAGLADDSPFTALLGLQAALLAGDIDRIAAAGDRVAASREVVLEGRADAGARSRRLELTRNRLEDDTATFQELLSRTEDVDFAEAATRLTQQQTVLQASLASAARILQTTLFEFLG